MTFVSPYPPELKALVIERAKAGEKFHAINAELNISYHTIAKWVRKARERGEYIPVITNNSIGARKHPRIRVDRETAKTFQVEAFKRGYKGAAGLVNDLLRVIAAEPHLIEAILDDN